MPVVGGIAALAIFLTWFFRRPSVERKDAAPPPPLLEVKAPPPVIVPPLPETAREPSPNPDEKVMDLGNEPELLPEPEEPQHPYIGLWYFPINHEWDSKLPMELNQDIKEESVKDTVLFLFPDNSRDIGRENQARRTSARYPRLNLETNDRLMKRKDNTLRPGAMVGETRVVWNIVTTYVKPLPKSITHLLDRVNQDGLVSHLNDQCFYGLKRTIMVVDKHHVVALLTMNLNDWIQSGNLLGPGQYKQLFKSLMLELDLFMTAVLLRHDDINPEAFQMPTEGQREPNPIRDWLIHMCKQLPNGKFSNPQTDDENKMVDVLERHIQETRVALAIHDRRYDYEAMSKVPYLQGRAVKENVPASLDMVGRLLAHRGLSEARVKKVKSL